MSPQHLTLCTQLRDHLDAELTCYRTLLGLAERKQRDLIAAHVTSFAALVQQEQHTLLELGRLRQARDRLTRAVATLLNLGADFRTSALLERVPDPLRAELARRRHDLLTVADRLRLLNERNALLIRQSLHLVRDILGAVMGPDASAGAYDRRGLGGGVPTPRGGLVNLAG